MGLMLPPNFRNIWKPTRLALSVFVLAVIPSFAVAETFSVKYIADWNGLNVGEMTVMLDQNNTDYTYKVILDSVGLVRTFTNYRSENMATGKIVNGKPVPGTFFTEWWRKKEHQQVTVIYKNGGKIAEETANPPEKRPKRPIVEPKYKNNTLDTVTSALWARERIRELVESKPSYPQKFTMPVFDGRRRFDVELTINGYKKKKYAGKEEDLLEIVFYRTPVNGFNEKELLRMKQQDPTVIFYLDNNYIPVMGTGSAPFGSANLHRVSLCQSVDIACK